MATAQEAGPDLRGILEQDRLAVLDLLEQTRKLVLEVRTSHYWSEHGVETLSQLEHIGGNLKHMLELLEPHWEEGKRIFNRPEAAKLWKTSGSLLRALPPIKAKFVEQLDRRRRQRIMGQDYEELPEVTAEQAETALDEFRRKHAALMVLFESMQPLFNAVPPGLAPLTSVAAPSPNGQHAEVSDGASVKDIAQ